jgi:beta-glucosidase
MAKHWPGGGSGEGGRDAHYCFGQYAVYPGDNFETHLKPFTEGAFNLKGKTGMCAAVMPYYTISYGQDPSGKNVANGFSKYIITDLLREKYNYDGVVCTDWGITGDNDKVHLMNGKPWGVADLSVDERHFEVLLAGVDQFGGNNDKEPVIGAYNIWCERYGKDSADERFRLSASRLLRNFFRVGVFENPYVIPEETVKIVGCKEFVAEGYDAQVKSIVMVKNHDDALPMQRGKKVYMPERHYPASIPFFGRHFRPAKDHWAYPIDTTMLGKYFDFTDNPEEADFAVVHILSPEGNWGYSEKEVEEGGTGYIPISLQYTDYTAEHARKNSIAGGDPKENFTDRGYHGKSEKTYNIDDLNVIIKTKKAMGDKPVIVMVQTDRPFVPEFEPYAGAILLGFGVSNQAFLDIVSGAAEPYGLLPLQLPKDMKTVEEQLEDVGRDMECYVDEDGNFYNFAYGLNWNGQIDDWRVERYR